MTKKIVVLFLFCACIACTKDKQAESRFSPGVCIAKSDVGAAAGQLSISVETDGMWRIYCSEPWISFDVQGGKGDGAFTAYYTSNESDVMNLTKSRVAKIEFCLDNSMVADTVVLVQQGFLSDYLQYSVGSDPAVSLEIDSKAISKKVLICCSSEGADSSSVRMWVDSQNADYTVVDGNLDAKDMDFSIVPCNYKGYDTTEEYLAFRTMVEQTMNSSPSSGSDWIVAGQMYHYSMMQAGYDSTPSWYPSDLDSDKFNTDRYAWQNNLYDVLWMKKQNYVSTYSEAGREWCADYIYVSASVLAKVSDIELLPVPVSGMVHNPLKLTLIY